jgi:hypothetical protein
VVRGQSAVVPSVGGARFDASEEHPYPFYYSALDAETALAETLLRDLPPGETGMRRLPPLAVAARQLSGLALTRDLVLVSLISGKDLAAVGQDAWLVTAAGRDYLTTRAWGHWLRGHAQWAHGLIWSSFRNPGGLAVMLFGDRCRKDFGPGYERVLLHEVTELAVDLDDEPGTRWLNKTLAPYRAEVAVRPRQ